MEPFRKAFRGYDPAQVDSRFAELLAGADALRQELESCQAELAETASERDALRERLTSIEDSEKSIREALVSAHRQSDEVMAQARHEAETLLQVARETAARTQEELRGRISDLQWQFERASLQKQRFLNEFRELLEGHLAELTETAAPSNGLAPLELEPESQPVSTKKKASAPAEPEASEPIEEPAPSEE
jgi:cell division septum initiation protein DivIVA